MKLSGAFRPSASERRASLRHGTLLLAERCSALPARGGFILIAVLVLVMLISMIAISLMFQLKAADTAVSAGSGAEQAWSAAMSGVREAIRVARAAKPGVTDWEENAGAFKDRLVFDDVSERWYFTVYSPASSDDALSEMRYGLTSEAGKLNINAAHTTNLTHLPRMTVPLIAALRDFVDWDSDVRPDGAEQEHYDALPRAYTIRNGPLDTLDELLLVRGFTPSLLYGEDSNMNWCLDVNENDADERFPSDNADGKLDRGFSQFLTVASYDPNEDNEGIPRTNLNLANDPLPQIELPGPLTNFIHQLRTNKQSVAHPVDLLDAKLTWTNANGTKAELASGVGKDELGLVLDLFTTSRESRFDGLIDVNTASIAVLRTVQGIDEPLAESIVSGRRSISPERRSSLAWLLQEGIVDVPKFKEIAPLLTARSRQFSFHVVGYGVPSGRYRVLEVIIDVAGDEPRITYLRDLTKLGMPFPLTGPELTTTASTGAAMSGSGQFADGRVGRVAPSAPLRHWQRPTGARGATGPTVEAPRG